MTTVDAPATPSLLADFQKEAREWLRARGPFWAASAGGHLLAVALFIPGVNVAGKTGTAENRPGEAPHGWFIGFAPAEAPTVVVAVIVENTPEGGVTAAPLGAQVMRVALGK